MDRETGDRRDRDDPPRSWSKNSWPMASFSALRRPSVVPEDHRATIEFPRTIGSGPVELIVLVPAEDEAEEKAEATPR